jgi:IclR family transcriptional regulator, acetate operon repressor
MAERTSQNKGNSSSRREVGINRSVERALRILKETARTTTALSFAEFQKRLKLPKATLHKLLWTLESLQFLNRDEHGKYTIGLAALEVGMGGAPSDDIRSVVSPILQKLVRSGNETCYLGLLDAGEIAYLDRVDPPEQMVRLGTIVGRRLPAYATAGGNAALSTLYDESILTLFPEVLPTILTPNTVRTREALQARLAVVREKGYAVDLEESFLGVRWVGVAARAVGSWPIITLSFAIPVQRAPMERLHELAKPLKEAAREIETTLGFKEAQSNRVKS